MSTGTETYVAIEKRIDKAEGNGILARWEFGRALLDERVGKQLPKGRLDEIAKAIGRSRQEIGYRMVFAKRYPTRDKVANAIGKFSSWYEIIESFNQTTGERMVSSTENEWYTPAKYLESARKVLGGIDLDPASCQAANEIVQATQFFTKDDDGMAKEWRGRVWLNPPYGLLASSFVRKLVDAFIVEEVSAAIVLVNAHCTDTSWFQSLWEYPLCFTDHRIDFVSVVREKETTSTHGSVFGYLGSDNGLFVKEFRQWGPIVRRCDGDQ